MTPKKEKPAEILLHDVIRGLGPKDTDRLFEYVWREMLKELGDPNAMGWDQKTMQHKYRLVISNSIFDAYDGQVPEEKERAK